MPVLEPRTWIQIPVLPLRCCLLRHVWVFVTPRTAAHQASVSFTISRSLLKLLSTELIPFNHLILCRPLLLPSVFPSIRVYFNELALCIRWPQYGASASASVLAMNIQGWFPLGLTGLISLQSKGPLRVFSNTTVLMYRVIRSERWTIMLLKTEMLNI